MAEIQTRPTGADVDAFLAEVPQPRRGQAQAVRELMARVTGEPGVMWGPAIIGFGTTRYEAKTTSGETMVVGVSPRKDSLTLYGVYQQDFPDDPLFDDLGPHSTSKYCLHMKSLDGVDQYVLERLVRAAWDRADKS